MPTGHQQNDKHKQELAKIGQQRFDDREAARRRVASELDARYGRLPAKRKVLPRFLYAAAAVLLLIGVFFFYPSSSPDRQLARALDELRVPPSTELVSTTRSASVAGTADPLQSAITAYHGGDFAAATSHWELLTATEADETVRQRYRFYLGVSQWLDELPALALETLLPLSEDITSRVPFAAHLNYVIGLCLLETEDTESARTYLRPLSAGTGELAENAVRLLTLLPPPAQGTD